MSDKHLDGRGENDPQHGTRPEKTKARPREGWRSEPDYGLPPKRSPLGPGPGRALIGVIVAVVLLGGLLAWFETRPRGGAGSSDIGGAFQLVDHNGKPADESILTGKWSAVFFGYTYCPDVCPATLQALGQAAMRLTPDQRKTLQVIFITIDPARDTPQQMKVYLDAQALPVKTIGLTGSAAQVAAVAKAYRVYFKKVGTGDAYTMDHTSVVYLMNPKGGFAAPLAHGMTPDLIAKQITAAERAG
jgi:protein SCO1/2